MSGTRSKKISLPKDILSRYPSRRKRSRSVSAYRETSDTDTLQPTDKIEVKNNEVSDGENTVRNSEDINKELTSKQELNSENSDLEIEETRALDNNSEETKEEEIKKENTNNSNNNDDTDSVDSDTFAEYFLEPVEAPLSAGTLADLLQTVEHRFGLRPADSPIAGFIRSINIFYPLIQASTPLPANHLNFNPLSNSHHSVPRRLAIEPPPHPPLTLPPPAPAPPTAPRSNFDLIRTTTSSTPAANLSDSSLYSTSLPGGSTVYLSVQNNSSIKLSNSGNTPKTHIVKSGNSKSNSKPVNLSKKFKSEENLYQPSCSKYPTGFEQKEKKEFIKPKINKSKITMPPHNQTLSLRDALAVIPSYDGQNLNLNMFIQGCKEALLMMGPDAETTLVRGARVKIIGEPRRTIIDQDFQTIEEMSKFLKAIYAPRKNVYQLQGELGSIYQQDNETVIAFANRVRDLGKQILECYEDNDDPASLAAFTRNTKESLPSCFHQGLKSEIEQRVKFSADLENLITTAVQVEKQLFSRAALRNKPQDSFNEGVVKPVGKRGVHLVAEGAIKCQLCDGSGHTAKECKEEKSGDAKPAGFSNNRKFGESFPAPCQICDKMGHIASSCFRVYPTGMSSSPDGLTICQECGKRGHTIDRCYKIHPPRKTDPGKCQMCQGQGHIKE